ncbi:AAA family ATPase (plasmid) [Spiroplasma citri]|nr:AAA family ATPase [Spiroplasma citri]
MCKNVAYKLALDGAKVLLIDLDPQATLSVQLISKKGNNENSLIELVSSKNALKHIKLKILFNQLNIKI